MHVTDRNAFKPLITGIAVIQSIARLFPNVFKWRTEPYEFVSDRPAIDLLYGHPEFRETLLPEERTLKEIEESWETDLADFQASRKKLSILLIALYQAILGRNAQNPCKIISCNQSASNDTFNLP